VSSTEPELLVRPAGQDDAVALAAVHVAARAAAVPAMPPSVHTEDEALRWVAGWLGGGDEV